MKKLLAISIIGSSLMVGTNSVKSNELIQHVNHGGNSSIIGIQSVNATTGATTTLATFNNGEAISYPQGIYFTNEFQGKYYVKASDSNGAFWFEYDNNSQEITKKSDLAIGSQLGMSQFPYGIKSVVSKNEDGTIQIGADANDIDVVEDGLNIDGAAVITKNTDGSVQIGGDTDDIDIVSDGLNIDGAAVITKNADGTIQIGTDENDIDITSEGLAIDGEPLITKKANGEFHIGKNSWITKEENGRQKVYAKDANGNPIPIDYTNGTKLLINGRDVEQSINNVGALSAALTGLPTVPTDTTLACGLGTGTHGGDFAFSGGCASKVNEKLSINYAASMTMPGQDYAGDFEDTFSARAGFVWKLGKATKPTKISMNEKKVFETKIKTLEDKNNQLLARLERLEKFALRELNSKDLAIYKLQ